MRPAASKPGSTARSLRKVWITSAALTSSASDSASWATIDACRRRRPVDVAAVPRMARASVAERSAPIPRSTGSTPASSVTAAATPMAARTIVASGRTSSQASSPAGTNASRPRTAIGATSRPSAAAAAASSALSATA